MGKYGQEMEVDSIRVNISNSKRIVVLKHKADSIYMPIWVGASEAEAIALKLHGVPFARPMTHDLLANSLKDMGGQVDRVVVNKLRDDTLFAVLQVDLGGRKIEIDCRPSDAIALAVRVGAPIFVKDEVLDQAGIEVDEADLKREMSKTRGTTHKAVRTSAPLGKQERKRLAVFSKFVQTLDLSSIGESASRQKDKQ